MGPDGLTAATGAAILAANYVATRLREYYPVLYTGAHGLVAHECILDLRDITKTTGVTVDDVAKRLIDYGFHAPTMSFPVAGTLMVEPTESEDRHELDRFVDAMIAIRGEIDRVAAGEWPAGDNPLANAPHTAECLVGEWSHAYPREARRLPDRRRSALEVLAAGPAHRRRVRRPQPGVRLPAGGRVRLRPSAPSYAGPMAVVPDGQFGDRVRTRLRDSKVIWLTTVGADGTPQPNPVWFLWDGDSSVLVYNRTDAHRLAHVAAHPQVALHLDGDGRAATSSCWPAPRRGPTTRPRPMSTRPTWPSTARTWNGCRAAPPSSRPPTRSRLHVDVHRIRGH